MLLRWLRDSTDAPDVLKAAAHAQKHSLDRQGSSDYDQEADDRLVKAAYDFNLNFAAQFAPNIVPAQAQEGAAGSSSNAPAVPLVASPRPTRPGKEAGMVAARAMASGGRVPAPPPSPAPPPQPVQPAPPPPCCTFENCVAASRTTDLRFCVCGGAHHHFCSINAGCEDDASQCARCLGVPIYSPPPPAGADGVAVPPVQLPHPLTDAAIATRFSELELEWIDPLEQTKLRGTAQTTNNIDGVAALLDAMGVDACSLLTPDFEYSFARSIYGEHRLNWSSVPVTGVEDGWTQLEGGPWVAQLMRPSRQPVPTAPYRNYVVSIKMGPSTSSLVPGGRLKFPIVPGAPAEGIICALPRQWSESTRELLFRLKLSKEGATATRVTINAIHFRPPPPAVDDDDGDDFNGDDSVPLANLPAGALDAADGVTDGAPERPQSESDGASDETDAVRLAVRAQHLETNMAMPEAEPGSMAAWARERLVRSDAALPGAGEAMVELPRADASPGANIGQQAMDVLAPADEEQPPPQPEPPPLPEAAAPPAQVAPPPAPVRLSARAVRKRARFGDAGELDGPASRFKSAPPPRKASIDPSHEMGVPAYAMPGADVWAMGLHAGSRKRFKAQVVKLRKLFPRIVVRYTADAAGNTSALCLPDPNTAYLTMSDVQPGTLIQP